MLFKLSVKNIKKSLKDYSIYFFTLVFAVSMFYMFNSIDAQSSMLILNNSKYDVIKAVVQLISYVSVFVSVILGFLIVYSNNFLIRRRKKEIGMYLILGMSKRKVSFILVLETLLIGVISLVSGLLLGVCLSQFLSLFTAKLFEADLTGFKFIFSSMAFNKTILYFGIIFLLVVIFNTIALSRYKVIDLINAAKKNEKVKNRNKYVTIVSFVLCILFLGYAYYLLLHENALVMLNYKLTLMIVSGSIGTFLLFFSLSGFLLKVFEHNKKVYYKGLNIFTFKQINSKINTSVASTSIICLMLLLTIGMLSGSMSLAKVFNGDLQANNLTDYTAKAYESFTYDPDNLNFDSFTNFEKFEELINSKELNKYTKEYVLFHKYIDSNLLVKSLMNKESIEKLEKQYGSALSLEFEVPIIKESEYQTFMKMVDKDYIDIDKNEYLIISNIDFIVESFDSHYKDKVPIMVNGIKLIPGSKEIEKIAYENYNTAGNDGILIVSDEVVNNLKIVGISLVGNFVDNNNEEQMGEDFEKFLNNYVGGGMDYRTRISMEASSLGLKVMVIFIGIYLGITFAISSATVLAIGQLSESSDNKKRYKILTYIGADNKIINKALFTQIAITFIFPLVVALIHAYFGLKEVNSLLIAFGTIDLTSNILLTTLFMIVVYGGYFIVTYLCSKNIIKND